MRLLLAAAILSLTAATAAYAAPESDMAQRDCFASSTWQGWSAADDGDTLYLRVRQNMIYRVELTPGSRARDVPGRFLINRVRGSNWICSALDLDLALADTVGFERPLIAQSLRRLSAEEAAALAPEDRP